MCAFMIEIVLIVNMLVFTHNKLKSDQIFCTTFWNLLVHQETQHFQQNNHLLTKILLRPIWGVLGFRVGENFNHGETKQTQRMVWTVPSFYHPSVRCLSKNIKTSVHEEFNILQTDVFIFCIKRLSNKIKRVQTNKRFTSFKFYFT